MLKIILICTSGISTTLLIHKIEEAAKKKKINTYVWATSVAEMKDQVPQSDIVLLGPQARHIRSKVKELVTVQPILEIDFMDYGTMNGDAVFDTVMKYFKSDL